MDNAMQMAPAAVMETGPGGNDAERHWLAIGLEAHRAGRWLDAEKAYKALLAEVPNSADGLHLSGVLIRDGGGDLNLAAAMIEAALDLRPERSAYWLNLGGVRQAAGDLVNAEHSVRRALALQPDYPAAWLMLADILLGTNRRMQAAECVERALALGAGQPQILAKAATFLSNHGDVTRAEIYFRRAIELAPEHGLFHAWLAVTLLREGRMEEGWKESEYRLAGPTPQVSLPLAVLDRWPRWQGEPLKGKSVLLCGEQGYGDVIQFARYAKLLLAQGATVDLAGVFACLETVMRTVPGARDVYADLPAREDYDFWVPMWSTPRWCGTTLETVPTDIPYLFAEPDRVGAWRKRMGPKPRAKGGPLRVGLVWAGRPTHVNDRFRSMRLANLRPLAEVPGVAWYSLQVGDAARAQLAGEARAWLIKDLGAELTDFADTAAVIDNLDLVVAVDTSVAHLAGAMGKPVWVLLPAWGVDWRWMRGRTDSPWYPSMRLFRQRELLHWEDVVADVATALADVASAPDGNLS